MEKTCSRCKEAKPLDGFAKNSKRPDGRQSWCRACNTVTRTEWARANRDKVRWHQLYTKYKITQEQYEAMLQAQDNKCAICLVEFSTVPRVDHDHETMKVRGLLCARCNNFVGYIETGDITDRINEYLGLTSRTAITPVFQTGEAGAAPA